MQSLKYLNFNVYGKVGPDAGITGLLFADGALWRHLALSAVGDGNRTLSLARFLALLLHLLDDVESTFNVTENDVLAVQPAGLDCADEELGAIGVGPGIGHGENSWSSMCQLEVLVSELLAVDALASCTVAAGEVSALAHEVGNDPVEGGTLEG